jgi:hypothetical protein
MALFSAIAALLLGSAAGILAANRIKPGRWCEHCGVTLVCPAGHPEMINGGPGRA